MRHSLSAKQQGRLDGFFKPAQTTSSEAGEPSNPARKKRLAEEEAAKAEAKKAKKANKGKGKKAENGGDSKEEETSKKAKGKKK